MSFLTIALYITAFGLWLACIHREGGIGGGVRFIFAFSLINQFCRAPYTSLADWRSPMLNIKTRGGRSTRPLFDDWFCDLAYLVVLFMPAQAHRPRMQALDEAIA